MWFSVAAPYVLSSTCLCGVASQRSDARVNAKKLRHFARKIFIRVLDNTLNGFPWYPSAQRQPRISSTRAALDAEAAAEVDVASFEQL